MNYGQVLVYLPDTTKDPGISIPASLTLSSPDVIVGPLPPGAVVRFQAQLPRGSRKRRTLRWKSKLEARNFSRLLSEYREWVDSEGPQLEGPANNLLAVLLLSTDELRP